jgi:hypothetical protein
LAKGSQARWSLFVDESGRFEDIEDDVSIAGVLIRDGLPGGRAQEIRASLEQACRPMRVPWPLHATYVNLPAYFAAVLANDGRSQPDSVVDRALSVFRARLPDTVETVLKALAAGAPPNHDQLRELDNALRIGDPVAYALLDLRVQKVWAAIGRVLAALAAVDGPAGLLVVAASETLAGDGDEGQRGKFEDSRYIGLLRCLTERTARLLERLEGEHRLEVWPLTRHLEYPDLGALGPLRASDVSQAFVSWCTSTNRVKVLAGVPMSFDRYVHGAAVIADFAANYVRRVAKQRAAPLSTVESWVEGRLGVRPRSGTPERSHFAATGLARAWVCWGVRRETIVPTSPLTWTPDRRRWAIDQAVEWL